jgi:uncharacterized protein (DUF302 family)
MLDLRLRLDPAGGSESLTRGRARRRVRRIKARRKSRFLEERVARGTPLEVRARIEETLRRHDFLPLGIRDISDFYLKTGQPVPDPIFACEFSSPGLARDAFRAMPQLAALGPSRIAVYVVGGKTRVAALLPSAFEKLLPAKLAPPAVRRGYRRVVVDYDRRIRRVLQELCG